MKKQLRLPEEVKNKLLDVINCQIGTYLWYLRWDREREKLLELKEQYCLPDFIYTIDKYGGLGKIYKSSDLSERQKERLRKRQKERLIKAIKKFI